MKIRTCPDFQFLFVKNKIRTCPDLYLSIEYLKSGLVQISYLDVSRFEIFDGKFWIWTCPNFNFGHVQIFFFFALKKINPNMSRFLNFLWEKKNSDLSRFLFINWIFQIWTCPDLNLDLSRFEIFDWKFQIRTCPDLNYGHVRIFFFQLKIWNLDLSRYQFWTSDSHVDRGRI